jgi:hypothetical protein
VSPRRNTVAAPDSENGVIQFENVGLRYGLGPEILRDLSFKITPHSFQFLSGAWRHHSEGAGNQAVSRRAVHIPGGCRGAPLQGSTGALPSCHRRR